MALAESRAQWRRQTGPWTVTVKSDGECAGDRGRDMQGYGRADGAGLKVRKASRRRQHPAGKELAR